MDIEAIVERVRRECAIDHVGLWRIPWHFREVEKVADVSKRRALSLEVVERLLAQKEIGVGEFANGQFVFWSLSPSAAMQRIQSKWLELAREPNLGDIAWFTTKD